MIETNYQIINGFTLKEKFKIWLGMHNKNNFECYSCGRKVKVHLTPSYSIILGAYCPHGYVEVLKGKVFKLGEVK